MKKNRIKKNVVLGWSCLTTFCTKGRRFVFANTNPMTILVRIRDIGHHFEGSYGTVHVWTLICLSLGILGPNERAYLGDDLKDVDVFHPETSMF